MWKIGLILASMGLSSYSKPPERIIPDDKHTWNAIKYLKEEGASKEPPHQDCWEKDCVIYSDLGGYVTAYIASAKEVLKTKHKVILVGYCASACTGFIEILRDHVCISEFISLGFHADTEEMIPNWYSDFVLNWAKSKGGFPSNSSGIVEKMDYNVAKEHWRTCTKEEMDYAINGR